jgi:hypothetical protein
MNNQKSSKPGGNTVPTSACHEALVDPGRRRFFVTGISIAVTCALAGVYRGYGERDVRSLAPEVAAKTSPRNLTVDSTRITVANGKI